MKRLSIALLSCTVLLLASCKKEEEKPKVIYDNKGKRISKVDSTQVAISDLPIQMEGTD
jgi:PBP1b-binding outer membrane lipoprotein LpoB